LTTLEDVVVEGEAKDVVDLSKENPWTLEEVERASNSMDGEEEVEVGVESSSSLSFRKRMQRLLPHSLSFKERLKDRTISYVDLLQPDTEGATQFRKGSST